MLRAGIVRPGDRLPWNRNSDVGGALADTVTSRLRSWQVVPDAEKVIVACYPFLIHDYGSLKWDRFCNFSWAHFAARRLMNRSFS